MLTAILNFFAPPVFQDDEEQTRIASLLNTVLLFLNLVPLVLIINGIRIPANLPVVIPITAFFVIVSVAMFYLMRRGYVRFVSRALVALLFLMLGYLGYLNGGQARPVTIYFTLAIVIAGLLLGGRGAIFSALASGLLIGILTYGGNSGIIQEQLEVPTADVTIIAYAVGFILIGIVLQLASNNIGAALSRAKKGEAELSERNRELQELSTSLELRVQERTAELKFANQYNERRARQFEAISQVSRAINQTQSLQELLPQITQVINQQFNFYHIGIFLLDTNNEYAVLVASNSEGGQKMLARNHKLKVGQVGIVGNVAGSGIPRIALDTGADAIYFNNPNLPETRSEMALPLFRSGQQLIGVMDVQSTDQNAFGQDDIQILTTLADQVSIAIANARLYEETQKALLESETLYRRDIQMGWAKFTRSQKIAGIRRQGMKSDLLLEPIELPGAVEVTRSGETYQKKADGTDKSAQMTIPMKLRGEIVGMLNVKTDADRTWSADDMDIITAIVERAALSIENARLLNESQKRAIREQTISQMSAKIGAGTEIETILKTAVRELGTQISDAQITVEIGSENE